MTGDDARLGGPGGAEAQSAVAEQAQLIADHEARHGPLPGRILGELRSAERFGGAMGAKAAGAVGSAGTKAAGAAESSAEALHIEVVSTELDGPRALAGHVLGMRLLLPAEGVHGPRETAALLYLFRDALGIRPTDDAPMSAVPLVGLHLVMPHVAMAHWVYKAGRTAHATMDLARQEREFESSLPQWTVDDFREATPKLQVHPTADIPGPVRLYAHLGFVRLTVPTASGPPVRLKSALLESTPAYLRMWKVFDSIRWPGGLTMEEPEESHQEPSAPPGPADGQHPGDGPHPGGAH